jgi:hypothetical protein
VLAEGLERGGEWAAARQPQVRCELEQWDQHEAAPRDAGVRNHQLPLVEPEIAEQQQVDVDRAWGMPAGRPAAERALQPLADGQEVPGAKRGLRLDDRVVEVALAGSAVDRFGLIDRRAPGQLDALTGVQSGSRRAKVLQPVADVRAEPQMGAAQRSTSTETSSTGSGMGGSGLVALTTTAAALKRSSIMSATAVQSLSSVRYERSVAINATAWQTAL